MTKILMELKTYMTTAQVYTTQTRKIQMVMEKEMLVIQMMIMMRFLTQKITVL